MSSSIGEETEAALAGVAEEVVPLCCQFAEKITVVVHLVVHLFSIENSLPARMS